MIRVVLDTNVVVSALLAPDGIPAVILDLALQRLVRASTSEPALDELERVLRRPKFGLTPRKVGSFMALFKSRVRRVSPSMTLSLCKDHSDDRFLECAGAAKAEFLITGNRADFPRRYRDTAVVSPAEFWEIYLLRAGF